LARKKTFKNIGFISTRIAGTDGVSLEIDKWASVLKRNNYQCFYLSGENDRPADESMLVEQAHFQHPDIQEINEHCYGETVRSWSVTKKIHELRQHLKEQIYEFVRRFDIDLLIPENALAIPLNIPLGLALAEFIAERGFPAIAHHHDFTWERERFLVNALEDYISWAFPPNLPSIQHVVINSIASRQLSYRKGISNTIIPNVYDFANSPKNSLTCPAEIKEKIGLQKDDFFILQPTRVVPRKWVERSLEIVKLMKQKNPTLVLSHSADDEGDVYNQRVKEYAHGLGVSLISIENLVGPKNYNIHSEKKYTVGEIYTCADLVCYPSGYEGFGNAFLEAIYYKKPIVVNRYSIYIADIEPKGFDTITIEGFVTSQTIKKIFEVLTNQQRRKKMVEKNYSLGKRYFSYNTLEFLLLHLISILEIQQGTKL
jgi:mannosylglucosylglycerate synthase